MVSSMVSGNSKNDKGKSKKVVASVAKPASRKKSVSSITSVSRNAKPVIASRTRSTIASEKRMTPDEIEVVMQSMTATLVENVEHILAAVGTTWSDLSERMGLGRSTVYQFKNGRANAGSTMAIRIAKALDVDAWALFLPSEKFKEYFKANFEMVAVKRVQ